MSYNSEYYLAKFNKNDLSNDWRYKEWPKKSLCHYDEIGDFSILDRECHMKLSLNDDLGCAWIFEDKILRNRIEFDTIKFIDVDILNKNKSDYYAIVYIDWS